MKILVTVKRVIDPYVRIQVKPNGEGVETRHVKMALNPFDEIALEEALRFVERKEADEVVVVSIGDEAAQETLRQALAMGAHRAILVSEDETDSNLTRAKILKAIVEKEKPDLVLMGKQAIDTDSAQTPAMLATLLNWPYALFASKIAKEGNAFQVVSEVDGGLLTVSLELPAVISVDLRLNEPRYATLPNIMKAKMKPLEVIDVQSLNIPFKAHEKRLNVRAPEVRKAGEMVHSVSELLQKLKNEKGMSLKELA